MQMRLSCLGKITLNGLISRVLRFLKHEDVGRLWNESNHTQSYPGAEAQRSIVLPPKSMMRLDW